MKIGILMASECRDVIGGPMRELGMSLWDINSTLMTH